MHRIILLLTTLLILYINILQIQCNNDFHLPVMSDFPEAIATVEVGATGSSSSITPMSCMCEDYECICRKECICKIVENPSGDGSTIEAAQKKAQADAEKGNQNPITFKCGCDFGGADFSMSKEEGLDCDCSAAKCTCQRKCTCRPAANNSTSNGTSDASGGSGGDTQPKFRDVDLEHIETQPTAPTPSSHVDHIEDEAALDLSDSSAQFLETASSPSSSSSSSSSTTTSTITVNSDHRKKINKQSDAEKTGLRINN